MSQKENAKGLLPTMKEKFYITTAIAYASRKPHIGNTYEAVLADAIARFKKLEGYDVFLLTGTDEHGQKVETLAKESNITPKEYVNKVSHEIQSVWDLMQVDYQHFIRTTDPKHMQIVQKIFQYLYDKGDIYKGNYQGMYCVPCESFFTESQLVDGKCPDCGRPVTPACEEAYFFRMSKYQDKLLHYINEHPEFIQPKSREHEMVNNFLKPGLQDLCVSRTSFSWGVPVDFDKKHVIYVWLDALVNYITAIGYQPDGSSQLFEKLWPADLQIIGKDILRFHTIYWPIILMALDLPLPKQILGHPWLLSGNGKMSKSIGNVIYADTLADAFSTDAVRFYLLSEMPYAQDGGITYESFITHYNAELANTLGNLINRTVSMVNKYFQGNISAKPSFTPLDDALKEEALNAAQDYLKAMRCYKTANAMEKVLSLARRCNKYIDETTPWLLGKEPAQKERLAAVLACLLEGIRFLGIMLEPIMPQTSAEILRQINAQLCSLSSLADFSANHSFNPVATPKALFPRMDEKEALEKLSKVSAKAEKPNQEEAPTITIDDFAKVSMVVAQVKECEKVKKSKKLLKLQVDDGSRQRQIVSGIAEHYRPDELIGKKIILVNNLKTVKLCGVQSEGMILAVDMDNKVQVVFPQQDIKNGCRLR